LRPVDSLPPGGRDTAQGASRPKFSHERNDIARMAPGNLCDRWSNWQFDAGSTRQESIEFNALIAGRATSNAGIQASLSEI